VLLHRSQSHDADPCLEGLQLEEIMGGAFRTNSDAVPVAESRPGLVVDVMETWLVFACVFFVQGLVVGVVALGLDFNLGVRFGLNDVESPLISKDDGSIFKQILEARIFPCENPPIKAYNGSRSLLPQHINFPLNSNHLGTLHDSTNDGFAHRQRRDDEPHNSIIAQYLQLHEKTGTAPSTM
jgi:hypothetical protein